MIILDPEETEAGVVAHAVRAPDSDQHYAMVDSGTNAIIVPLLIQEPMPLSFPCILL